MGFWWFMLYEICMEESAVLLQYHAQHFLLVKAALWVREIWFDWTQWDMSLSINFVWSHWFSHLKRNGENQEDKQRGIEGLNNDVVVISRQLGHRKTPPSQDTHSGSKVIIIINHSKPGMIDYKPVTPHCSFSVIQWNYSRQHSPSCTKTKSAVSIFLSSYCTDMFKTHSNVRDGRQGVLYFTFWMDLIHPHDKELHSAETINIYTDISRPPRHLYLMN